MLRMIVITCLFGVGTLLSFKGIAYAACFFIWSDIFRPLDFTRRVLDFPSTHYVVIVLAVQLFIHRW